MTERRVMNDKKDYDNDDKDCDSGNVNEDDKEEGNE